MFVMHYCSSPEAEQFYGTLETASLPQSSVSELSSRVNRAHPLARPEVKLELTQSRSFADLKLAAVSLWLNQHWIIPSSRWERDIMDKGVSRQLFF